jgi:hypothetical protein
MTIFEIHTKAAGLVLLIQLVALWLSMPFRTFALRGPIFYASFVVTGLIVASEYVSAPDASLILLSIAVGICLFMISFPRYRQAISRRRMQSVAKYIRLEPPFTGRWTSVASGPDSLLNHHVVASDQYYASDFIHGNRSYGQPILAPGRGRVVDVSDDSPDHATSSNPDKHYERGKPFGNFIVLEIDDGFVFLCHLRCGSIVVRRGDEVAPRQVLAQCGNSGRSTGAHLHIHAQKTPKPDPFRAQGLPIAFRVNDTSYRPLVTGDQIVGLPDSI